MQQKAIMVPGMDAAFMHWAALTDAYAQQLAAMQRGEPAARDEAARLSVELRGIHGALGSTPPSHLAEAPQLSVRHL